MTITQISNYLNILVQQHKAQVFTYPSLKYYMYGSESESQNNRQNNSNPTGATGRQYPFLLCSYADTEFDFVAQGSRVRFDFDLYFYDLMQYGNNGTTNNRSTIEIQRDLTYIARDIMKGLNDVARLQRIQINQDSMTASSKFEFVSNQNNEKVCILRVPLTIEAGFECSGFVFDAGAIMPLTPYPATIDDYEKNVS